MASRSLLSFRSNGETPAPYSGNPFLILHHEMNRMFDEMLGAFTVLSPATRRFAPTIDVSETQNELRFKVDLPGVPEDDVEVSVEGDELTIRGEKREEATDDNENYQLTERAFGAFQRTFRLPSSVDADKVSAEFENGVLRIIAPKTASPGRSHKVEVRTRPRQRSRQSEGH